MAEILSEEYKAFVAQNCDRLSFLQKYLSDRSVQSSVVPVNGRHHLYVNFPSSFYNPIFKIKTIIAHYDRVALSPGANDNSSGVFAVADFAARLQKRALAGDVRNIRIFFTDGEELGEGGVSEQGAFGLAELFRKVGIINDDVYVFDSVGRGDVPILAQAGLNKVANSLDSAFQKTKFAKRFADLYSRTQDILRAVSREKWMTLPVPYSDNAGFLACGIPSVAITMLPENEASLYFAALQSDKDLASAVMNCAMKKDENGRDVVPRFRYEEQMPNTWRLFHTEYDNILSLTPKSFDIIKNVLDAIADSKTLA